MQTNNQIIHIKVVLNNEFRRFSMDKADFSRLVETIRTVYSLDSTEKFKVCFIDDEKDLVAISSDEEFLYAVDLVRPLRLVLTLASAPAPVETPCQVEPHCHAEPHCQASYENHGRRGGRGGHGKQGWHEERKKWRENESLSREERIQRKTARISERIDHIKVLLLADLPASRERTLSWKLEKLQSKLENLQLGVNSPTETAPSVSNPEVYSARGCRGRGRGRRFEHGEAGEGCGKKWSKDDPIFENTRTCRQNLKAAYESENKEEIDRCLKALGEAKLQRWEAKHKAREERDPITRK